MNTSPTTQQWNKICSPGFRRSSYIPSDKQDETIGGKGSTEQPCMILLFSVYLVSFMEYWLDGGGDDDDDDDDVVFDDAWWDHG